MKKLFLLGLLIGGAAFADESDVELEDGPGKKAIVGNCQTCHSLDYIPMNSVFQDRKGWEATVNKMVKAMGAPIPEKDVPVIVDYLTEHYGK